MNPSTTSHLPLQDNEHLIWQGRPGRSNISKTKRIAAILLGLLLGITALIAAVLDPANAPAWLPENILLFFTNDMVILILLIFTIGFLLYPIIIHRILSSTYYIVTDRRLITLAVSGSSGGIPSLSRKRIEGASTWYTSVQGATCTPVGDELCNLRLWVTDIPSPEHRAQGVLYLPQDIAEYIHTQCSREAAQ